MIELHLSHIFVFCFFVFLEKSHIFVWGPQLGKLRPFFSFSFSFFFFFWMKELGMIESVNKASLKSWAEKGTVSLRDWHCFFSHETCFEFLKCNVNAPLHSFAKVVNCNCRKCTWKKIKINWRRSHLLCLWWLKRNESSLV